MKIAIASDHRGFELKEALADFLKAKGHEVIDFGTHSDESCDYPDYVYPAAKAVQVKNCERAILICYTGIGSSIAANKVKGICAALTYNAKAAKLSRQHNNSNILVLPAYLLKTKEAQRIVSIWLKTEFEG